VTKTVYVAADSATVNKFAIAAPLIRALTAAGDRVGVFRPLVESDQSDPLAERLREVANVNQSEADSIGISYAEYADNPDAAVSKLVAQMGALRDQYDTVVAVGSDFADVSAPVELGINAKLAANLDCPVIALTNGKGKTPDQLRRTANYTVQEFRAHACKVLAMVVSGIEAQGSDLAKTAMSRVLGDGAAITFGSPNELDALDYSDLVRRIGMPRQQIRTQHRFEYEIMKQARSNKQTIVLPESEDARILSAAAILQEKDAVNLVLLGEADEVNAHAAELGLDISKVQIVSMNNPEAVERYAAKLTELRAAKGMTMEKAREEMKDSAFFGTMMVYLGEADGMVSGAAHTTANTIRPALQTVKTRPGVKVVSGAFFMCMNDQVWLFADCAVNPNPTPADLADIAISSAETAAAFGIDPRVALISYSTGTSGAGPSVDATAEAVRIVQERRPDIPLAGPIQFDAAVDRTVGERKMPGNPVAGQATVFVFPDLNCGNAVYKAVQRTSGAVAVGPVLQGLNKPITDLSRGANVDDIVSTVAITAVQAQTM
jgi:phosphate acetyltransferase